MGRALVPPSGDLEGQAETFVRDQERENIVSAKSSVFQSMIIRQHHATQYRKKYHVRKHFGRVRI